jgi:3-phosphoglycerate kinase
MTNNNPYDNIKRLEDFNFNGKKVLMRVDFNVPQDKNSREITSDTRIRAALPSIRYVLNNGAEQLLLVSHLGKPKKEAEKGNDYTIKLSHDKTVERLEELLGETVTLFKDYMSQRPPKNKIVLLENIRFQYDLEQSKEEIKREELAKHIGQFAEIFINDAFGTCHRKEALIYDIAKYLPSGIGYLVDKEIKYLSQIIQDPDRPYIALLGGAKVEDKIEVIDALSKVVDSIYIIGAMEFAFQKALGNNVGQSLCEGVDTAKKVINSTYWNKIKLPVDTVIAKKENDNYTDVKKVKAGEIPEEYAGLDIGDETIKTICDDCSKAGTIFWNGPAGLFETSPFDKGTYAIAKHLAKLDNVRVVGGGDSVTAIEKAKIPENKFTHISTGGGASLEFLQYNGKLPALDILIK